MKSPGFTTNTACRCLTRTRSERLGVGLADPFVPQSSVLMTKQFLILSAILFGSGLLYSSGFAASECRDADGNVVDQTQCTNSATGSSTTLPDDAMAQVNELKAKMRYFTAIGFHKQSKEQRDAIAQIYAEHGVPLPDEYKE